MIEDEVVPQSKKYRNEKPDKEYRINVQLIAQTSLDEGIADGLTEDERIEAVLELRSIHLEWLSIKKIENLEVFSNLNVLYLQNNKITKIQNLQCLKNLQYLALNDNFITQIKNLKMLKKLIGLNCNNNQIEDLETEELPVNLQLLSFKNNPIAMDANYKRDIIKALKSLQVLDDHNITPEERFKCIGKFPQHLLQYAANLRQFRTKRQVEKKLVQDSKPLYLGGGVDETEAIKEMREKTRKFMHISKETFKTEQKQQEENFEEKIKISRKIRDFREEASMKMSQIMEVKEEDEN